MSDYLGADVFQRIVKPNLDSCLHGNIINYQEWFNYPNLGRRFVDITYFPYRDTYNNIVGVISNTRDITERKKAEEALRMSEDLLNSSQRLSKTGGWEMNVESKAMYWTKETYRIHDITPGEIEPGSAEHIKLSLGCYHREDRPVILSAFQRCLKKGQPYDLQFPFTSVKGRQLWIRTSTQPVIENGKTIRIIGNITDITERKLAEEKLKDKYSRLNLAMQSANMAWWEMDTSTGMVVFEKRKAEMLGYAPENFNHYKDFMALVHPDDSDKAMNAMRKHLDGTVEKYEVEYRILNNSGEYKWFYDTGGIVKKESEGKPLKVAGLVIDITERKRREEQNAKMLSMQQSLNTFMLEQYKIDDYEQLIKTVVTQIDQLFSPIASVFSEYDQDARVLKIKGFKVNQYILNLFVKIGGKRILSRVTPVNEDMYKEMTSEQVKIVSSMYDAFGGAVSKTVTSKLEKALKIKSYIGFSHIVDDQVFGTTVIALKEEPEYFVIEFMKNYAHYISNSVQRVLALQALKESEARFQMAMHAASEGIWDWNVSTNEYYYNPGYFRMLGFEYEEFPANTNLWKQLMHPNDKANVLEAKQQCIDGSKEMFEAVFRMKTKEGKWRWIMGRGSAVLRDGNGKVLRMAGTHIDITRIVETEQ